MLIEDGTALCGVAWFRQSTQRRRGMEDREKEWGRTERVGGGVGTRPWWLALLACGGAYWPLALEPSAMTSRHPYYCGHPHCRGHPPTWGWESRMQFLPMASSSYGPISARYAVIMNTPGWEVLTTTSNVDVTHSHGC